MTVTSENLRRKLIERAGVGSFNAGRPLTLDVLRALYEQLTGEKPPVDYSLARVRWGVLEAADATGHRSEVDAGKPLKKPELAEVSEAIADSSPKTDRRSTLADRLGR